MSGIENLFAIEPTLPSIQKTKMSEQFEKWPEMLTTCLREMYPDCAKLLITVDMRKKDEQAGTAVGALLISSPEAEKSLYVPFVVNKFELCPLDVWMETKTQKVHPLTKDTFKDVFFMRSMSDGLDARPADSLNSYFNDPSLWSTNYPPLQGRYSYASGGYPILDLIVDTMSKEDADNLLNTLRDEPMLVAKFEKNGHKELITKLAAKTYKPTPGTNDYVGSAMQLIPMAVLDVKKDGPNKYSLLSTPEGLFDLSNSAQMSHEDLRKYLSKIIGGPEDFINGVDVEGERMVIKIPPPTQGVWLYDDIKEGAQTADDFGVYRVKTKTGLELDGLVITKIVDFKGNSKPGKLLLGNAHASYQPSIAGIKKITSFEALANFKSNPIRVGQTGSFVFIDDGKAIATIPVTITAIEGDSCDSPHATSSSYGPFSVCDLNGNRFKVTRGYGEYFELKQDGRMPEEKDKNKKFLDAHGMIEKRLNEYIIPKRMLWMPMAPMTDVLSTPEAWMMKEASVKMDSDPLNILWTGIVFDVSGNGLEKRSMDEQHLRVLLAAKGASIEKVASIVKEAKLKRRVNVHGCYRGMDKEAFIAQARETFDSIKTACNSLKGCFVKQAAEMDNSEAVDVVLSLNFINPDNISKFVAYRPIFEKVCDYLAELTMAARLGIKTIPEFACVTTMHKLDEVVEGLKKLEISVRRPSTKVAAASPLLQKYRR